MLLSQIPENLHSVLEVGSAEGVFTRILAGRVKTVTALEISRTAMNRAREHCSGIANINFVQGDLQALPFAGTFDAVICAGVLVYLTDRSTLKRTIPRLLTLIRPGGLLIQEHLWISTSAEVDGQTIHEALSSQPELETLNFLRHDEYGITVFRRKPR